MPRNSTPDSGPEPGGMLGALFWSGLAAGAMAVPAVADAASQPGRRHVLWLAAAPVVLIAVLLLFFYVAIRAGRRIVGAGHRRGRTEYVDIWSRYRLTQAQIDSATREEPPSNEGAPPDSSDPGPAEPRG